MAKYFTTKEFACNCCGVCIINENLVERLDALREQYGKPIYVSCGYRCPTHNKLVGGVENSQHVQGNAADIYVSGDYEEFYQMVLNSRFFDGVGYYPDSLFVHVDVRDCGASPNFYRWTGK